ncbi:MFS transporter [Nocardioides nanhaiensis]|uniref:MFS transporter n=1 Tax=Nocardioides nanhaiensis TaxID=1476871 RepID=A0ABP8W1R2_9ACTN
MTSRARLAVAAAFASQGLMLLGLTTRLPAFADRWSLSEVEISGLLLLNVLGAGAGSVLAERAAARRPSSQVLRLGLVVGALGVLALTLAPALPVFVAAMAVYGLGLGVVDAGTNMQAVALEHRLDRPVLPSSHAAWTAGGIAGSAFTLATGTLGVQVLAVLVLVPLAAACGPFLAREEVPASAQEAVLDPAPVPWRPLWLVGTCLVVFYLVDTATTTWSALYLDSVVTTPDRLLAVAALPYLLATLAIRLAGDGLVARHGPVPVLRTGAVVGCAGLVVVVTAPTWPVVVIGFLVTGLGVGVVAPLSFSAAARIAGGSRARVDAVIGRFNLFNYAGALLGAVLTGVIGRNDLRLGFALPMVLVLVLLPLAPAFGRRREASEPSRAAP